MARLAPIETPQALLLDLDGTLVDSEPMHRAAYRSYFAGRGWRVDEATYDMFVGRRADDVFDTEAGPWSGEDPAELMAAVVAQIPDGAAPEAMPGARKLIAHAASSGIPLALVTSANRQWVELTLGTTMGVLDQFTSVVTRDDVREGKPDPAGFRLACEQLGVEPGRTLAFEDAPAGVRAARAAGVRRVVGVTTTWTADELRTAGATEVLGDLRGALKLLG